MAYVYVTEQGATLRKTGDRLLVTKNDETILDVRCREIEGVLLFGNVSVTTPAIRELMDHGIEMALLSRRGELVAQLTPPTSRNVRLRLAQYRRSEDSHWSLGFARSVVAAKIANGASLVRSFAKNHPAVSVASEISDLDRALERVPVATQLEALLGLEGTAAKRYFSAFGKLLAPGWSFEGRQRRPPRDPVNALLSFGYTLLFNEISSLLDGVGFDPYLGFYHQPDYGRPSLAADLVEEFRSPVVDRLTLRLINLRSLSPDDFERHTASGGLHLTRDALKRYLAAYDELVGGIEGEVIEVSGSVEPPAWPPDAGPDVSADLPAPSSAPISLRRRFRLQIHGLERALLGDEPYDPYRA